MMKIWIACAPWSQNVIYLHLLLLLACCSLIFNLVIRVILQLKLIVDRMPFLYGSAIITRGFRTLRRKSCREVVVIDGEPRSPHTHSVRAVVTHSRQC